MKEKIENLNSINWNGLSCFERSLCYASMHFVPSSWIAFLLLKMDFRNSFFAETKYAIGSDKYYHDLLGFLGLDFEWHYCFEKDFYADINHDVTNGFEIVLCANTFDIDGTKDFKNKNHPHFIFINQLMDKGTEIIDEDWTKEYWNKENSKTELIYLKKYVEYGKLKDYCRCFYKCNRGMEQDKFCYIRVYSTMPNHPNAFAIIDEYAKGIKSMLNMEQAFSMQNLNAIKNFYNTFQAYTDVFSSIEEKKQIKSINQGSKLNRFSLKNKYIYPGDLDVIGCHHFFLDAQNQALKIIFKLDFLDSLPGKTLNRLLDDYNLVKIFIAKDLYDKKPDHKDFLIKHLDEISKSELFFYKEILKMIEKTEIKFDD